MILRRITEHVRTQNWFAVGIDFLIVIVGVFIGIQVSNWNDARAEKAREALLLIDLRAEAKRNDLFAQSIGEGLLVGADAARRLLRMSDAGEYRCQGDCWSVVVDLMHASQWQQIFHQRTTYEELRRAGLPSDRRIIDAVEAYQQASHRAIQALQIPPLYRTLVRRRIPIELQDSYWGQCYQEIGSIEVYQYPCEQPATLTAIDPELVQDILADPEITSTLREWTSIARLTGIGLVTLQPALAEQIFASIDAAGPRP